MADWLEAESIIIIGQRISGNTLEYQGKRTHLGARFLDPVESTYVIPTNNCMFIISHCSSILLYDSKYYTVGHAAVGFGC